MSKKKPKARTAAGTTTPSPPRRSKPAPIPPSPPPVPTPKPKGTSTVAWSRELERDNFVLTPKVLFYLGRVGGEKAKSIRPRHILLIQALAARKFHGKPLRVHWETLGLDLGVKRDTVRKWAYDLEDMGLLRLLRNKGRDPLKDRPGYRNESNTFDYSPFVTFLEKARKKWEREQAKRKEAAP